jgi:hypothetical protein
VKLHAVDKEKPMKEFVGRKRQTVEKKSEEHNPIAARGLGDVVGAGEDDLIPFSDEPILLGLGEIDLGKLRWHPVGRRIGGLALPHLVLMRKGLYVHLQWWRLRGCEGAQERKEDAAMVAAAEQ